MRWFSRVLLTIAVIGAIVFFYQSAASHSRVGDDAPPYSVRRHDPYGTAALYDLLVERGIKVKTLEHPGLEPTDQGVLIRVLPMGTSRSGYDLRTRQLADWIADGNTVIELTRETTPLMNRLKIAATTQPSSSALSSTERFERAGGDPENSPAIIRHVRTCAGQQLMLWSPAMLHHKQPAGWRTLADLGDDPKQDSVVAGEFTYGKGKLVVVGAPTPALNGTIDADQNLDFLLSYLPKYGSVIIDEWSHGVGHEATVVGFLYAVGLIPAFGQLVLLAGLYLWSNAGLRPSDDIVVARRPSSAEQIETLGYLYSRSLSPELTFSHVQGELERRVADALHCRLNEVVTHLSKLSSRSALGQELATRYSRIVERLSDARPVKVVRCYSCGYDLRSNNTGVCPECNQMIPVFQRNELAELPSNLTAGRHAKRPDSVYADVLTAAYQLAQEIQRERRAAR